MKEIKIQIPEDVVNGIQLKDFEAVSMQAVITGMLETHALDADARIIESPIFMGYQTKLAKVRREFEQAKNEMISTFVEEEVRKQVTNWNLDYNSCILYLQLV
jgi:hypothetical protein